MTDRQADGPTCRLYGYYKSATSLCSIGTSGDLTETPQNVLVLQGQDAILNCSAGTLSPTGRNPITWSYDNDIITYSPCTSQHPGFVASSDSATACNLRALGSWKYGISGPYRCNDRLSRARSLATVVVLGEHNDSSSSSSSCQITFLERTSNALNALTIGKKCRLQLSSEGVETQCRILQTVRQ